MQNLFIPSLDLPTIQNSGQDWSQFSIPESKQMLRLEISPCIESISHTSFNDVSDDPESQEWVEASKELCLEAVELTGDESIMDLATDYLVLGQVAFFSLLADLYATHGFPVYDGEDYFEVYAIEDAQEALACQ